MKMRPPLPALRPGLRFLLLVSGLLLPVSGCLSRLMAQVDTLPVAAAALFASEDILELTLHGDMRALLNDRNSEAVYHPVEMTYAAADGQTVRIPLKVKTRGNFRRQRENCYYPPLLLNFAKQKTPAGSLFAGQDKLKLVTPCREQEHVVREYLVYKLYHLLTDRSFRARLLRVVYADTEKGKDSNPLYAMLLEDEDQMARRNGCEIVKLNGLRPNKMATEPFLTLAVFEYMIGNTDWSTQYRHNIKLLRDPDVPLPLCVPYDFDHAGIVQAPYARPAPELELKSVRDRRYRGYCLDDLTELAPVLARFDALRADFYAVYTSCDLLDDKYVRQTIQFLDDFYATIHDPEALVKAFTYPCLENGTGNVVIQGLRERE